MVVAAIGTVFAAGYLLWLSSAPRSAPRRRSSPTTRTSTTCTVTECVAWVPMLVLHRRARLLPQPHLPRHRPGRHPHVDGRTSSGRGAEPSCSPSSDVDVGHAPDVDYHALAPEIVLVGAIVVMLLRRPVRPRATQVARCRRSPASACSARARPGAHAGRRRHRPGRCSAAPTSSTTSRWCSRPCSSSSGYVVVLLSTNYIAEGDYWEGEYYFLMLVARCWA